MKSGSERLDEHFNFLFEMVPEINTVQGYLFYSLIAYLFIMFMGFLTNPTVEKIQDDYIESRKNLKQSTKMRQ